MTTFLLVPGACLGGAAWADVVAGLAVRGHDPVPVTLRGLGDRHDEADPSTDLHDHVDDVVTALGDRQDVVLVGHSASATVVWEAMPQLAGRVHHVVLLAGLPSPAGSSWMDALDDDGRAFVQAVADEHGDGWRLPLPRHVVDMFYGDHGLEGDAWDRFADLSVGHPLGVMATPVTVPLDDAGVLARRSHVVCSRDPGEQQALPAGWERHTLDAGHWPMLTASDALVALLDDLVPS